MYHCPLPHLNRLLQLLQRVGFFPPKVIFFIYIFIEG